MGNIEDFVPGANATPSIGKEDVADLVGEKLLDVAWAGFVAMKQRVEHPRRRNGPPAARCGPVLFDPIQYRADQV